MCVGNGDEGRQDQLSCGQCGATGLKGIKLTPQSVLVRCPKCAALQTIPERRQHPRESQRTSRFPAIDPTSRDPNAA